MDFLLCDVCEFVKAWRRSNILIERFTFFFVKHWEIYIKCKRYYLKRKKQENYSLGEKGKLIKFLLEEFEEQVLVMYT